MLEVVKCRFDIVDVGKGEGQGQSPLIDFEICFVPIKVVVEKCFLLCLDGKMKFHHYLHPPGKIPPTPIFGRLPLLTMETTFFSCNSFILAIAIFI